LFFALPPSEMVCPCKLLTSTPNAKIVPAHVFNLVACMADPQGQKVRAEKKKAPVGCKWG
jgi:hypothetical protein